MISTATNKKRLPADPNLDREIALTGAFKRLRLNGRRIALKNRLNPSMITETVRGTYASARVRAIIAAEIRAACADFGVTIEAVGLTPADLWEKEE